MNNFESIRANNDRLGITGAELEASRRIVGSLQASRLCLDETILPRDNFSITGSSLVQSIVQATQGRLRPYPGSPR